MHVEQPQAPAEGFARRRTRVATRYGRTRRCSWLGDDASKEEHAMLSRTRVVSLRDFDRMLLSIHSWAIAHRTEAECVRIRLELEYRRWLQGKALQALEEIPTTPEDTLRAAEEDEGVDAEERLYGEAGIDGERWAFFNRRFNDLIAGRPSEIINDEFDQPRQLGVGSTQRSARFPSRDRGSTAHSTPPMFVRPP
jgi:hypothetical protein